MPTYPTSPLVDFASQLFAAVAPGQAKYFQARVAAWHGAGSTVDGAKAVLGTLGERLGPGMVSLQQVNRGVRGYDSVQYPPGVRNYQLYPATLSVH
jgi:hypothetical protein